MKAETKTQNLVINADIMTAIQFPASIRGRFDVESAAIGNIAPVISKVNSANKPK